MEIPAITDAIRLDCDVLVIGAARWHHGRADRGGERRPGPAAGEGARAPFRRPGNGMDGVNNAVIPGKAEPEDYVAEITRANDGIVNQRTVYQTATRGFAMVQRLERYGVKFEKDEHGEYAVRQVHRSGSYVPPMPEGKDVKKALYWLRQRSMREKIRIENRFMPVRADLAGRAAGAVAFNSRTGEFVIVGAKAVIRGHRSVRRPTTGVGISVWDVRESDQCRRRLPMAYHAGAELSGIECFQINPLIKDYNGPACV